MRMLSLQRFIDGRIYLVQVSKCIEIHYFSVIKPLSTNIWKKQSLTITKSLRVKEELVSSFGKQSTYKGSSIKNNFSKINTPQGCSEQLILNVQSSPVVLKLQKRRNPFNSRSFFKSSHRLFWENLQTNDYSVDLWTGRDQTTNDDDSY